ncbi:hypothetical protein IscW_ISCW007980 [Ixodes scapularis]|uniref:Uncharacterized protein n=1 Tax=Ixodes scapularis TaxID=6945 RepID=B7PUL9_IXOSC|nr:hypothetical protein IscW_ISCW007980 [Ixodes scapularis]|eukprot:XP_002406297.1 hypothetical protein IscW_ISCW007980 [Ixodes scapularis]
MGAPDVNPNKKRKVELPSYKPRVPQDLRYNKVSHLPVHSTSRRYALCRKKIIRAVHDGYAKCATSAFACREPETAFLVSIEINTTQSSKT